MSFYLEKAIWSNIFAVPSEVVDRHIKLCGETTLKVLLVLLRHGGSPGEAELCRLLGESSSNVQDALLYWQQAGILSPAGAEQPAAPLHAEPAAPVLSDIPHELAPGLTYTNTSAEKAALPQGRQVKTFSSARGRLTTKDINSMAQQDENIAYLLQEAQSVLGKPLSPVSTDCVVSLYSYYGMQPDLVLMLLQYCVTMGKDNMRYIEKVASTWLENGVDSHEKAEREILRASEISSMEHKIKAAFGIYDRRLVDKELAYVDKWINDFEYGLDMISLAFERTVEQKGKLSFAYINGILSNWNTQGIKTPAQAQQDMLAREKQPAAAKAKGSSASSYDMQELEDMITYQNLLD